MSLTKVTYSMIHGAVINVLDYGAIGDGITDDSDAIQNALYANWSDANKSQLLPEVDNLTVYFPVGNYRITKQIHQPSGVSVIGDMPQTIQGLVGSTYNSKQATRIICDFPYAVNSGGVQWTPQSAWVISGFSLNQAQTGAPVGTLLDPYLYNCSGAVFDSGYGTRSVYTSIKGIQLVTDKNVACGLGVGMNPSAVIDISVSGFLYGCVMQSVWGSTVNLNGQGMFAGLVATQLNGGAVSGYLTGISSPPTNLPTVADSIPNRWHEDTADSYTGAARYWTTGYYIDYSQGVSMRITSEYWERASLFWLSGATLTSPYFEANTKVGIHAIGSGVTVTSPLVNNAGSDGFLAGNDGAAITVENWVNSEKVSISAGAGFDTVSPKINIDIVDKAYLANNETFRSDILIRTSEGNQASVYVSDNGNDSNTGLSLGNAVKTVSVAIARAKFYGLTNVIVDNNTVSFGAASFYVAENVNITITGSGVSSTITWAAPSNNIVYLTVKNSTLTFKNVIVDVPAVSLATAGEYAGAIVPVGQTTILFDNVNCTINSTYSALFSTGGGQGCGLLLLNLQNGSTLTGSKLSVDGTSNTGVRYLLSVSSGSSASGTLTAGSLFTLV